MNAQQRADRNTDILNDPRSADLLAEAYGLTVRTIKRILSVRHPVAPTPYIPSHPEATQSRPVVVTDIIHQAADGESYQLSSLADVQHELGGEVSLVINDGAYFLPVNDLARLANLTHTDPVPGGYGVHYQTPPESGQFVAVVEHYHVREGSGMLSPSWGITELNRYEFWVFYDRSSRRPHLLPTLWYPAPLSITRHQVSVVQFLTIPSPLALT